MGETIVEVSDYGHGEVMDKKKAVAARTRRGRQAVAAGVGWRRRRLGVKTQCSRKLRHGKRRVSHNTRMIAFLKLCMFDFVRLAFSSLSNLWHATLS